MATQTNLTTYQTQPRLHFNTAINNTTCEKYCTCKAIAVSLQRNFFRLFSSHISYYESYEPGEGTDKYKWKVSLSRDSNNYYCKLKHKWPITKFTRYNNLAKFNSNLTLCRPKWRDKLEI